MIHVFRLTGQVHMVTHPELGGPCVQHNANKQVEPGCAEATAQHEAVPQLDVPEKPAGTEVQGKERRTSGRAQTSQTRNLRVEHDREKEKSKYA
jgi:hypothetical protein